MGFYWDLFQQLQIHKRKKETLTLDERLAVLEDELLLTQDVLAQTLQRLEQMTGRDFDGDGQAP